MALERSWLNVVEVARESRRRFSGRADVMVRLFLVEGHNEGADVQKNEGSGVRLNTASYLSHNHVSTHRSCPGWGFLILTVPRL